MAPDPLALCTAWATCMWTSMCSLAFSGTCLPVALSAARRPALAQSACLRRVLHLRGGDLHSEAAGGLLHDGSVRAHAAHRGSVLAVLLDQSGRQRRPSPSGYKRPVPESPRPPHSITETPPTHSHPASCHHPVSTHLSLSPRGQRENGFISGQSRFA